MAQLEGGRPFFHALDVAEVNLGLGDLLKMLLSHPRQETGGCKFSLVHVASDDSIVLERSPVRIGRDPSNQFVIDDDGAVSREHAEIFFDDDAYWIRDLDSMNGTAVNGKRLSKQRMLQPGDRVTVGQTEFLIAAVPELKERDFGEYELVCEIARGGMGIVYRASSKRDVADVAIKELYVDSFMDGEKRRAREERFRREATLLNRLHHPNLVKVYDLKLGPRQFYYVMELLEGRNLMDELTAKGRLAPLAFLPILEQVGAALHYAHSKKVIHRDIKPDNIFILSDGTVKLTDFGVARPDDIESNLTRSGAILGTLGYAAPEQLNSAKRVDQRADIFSLAVVTYQVLSGQKPFDGKGITDVVAGIMSAEETPLHELAADVDRATSAIVARGMRKRPGDRYASVSEFVRDYKQTVLAVQTTP